MRSNAIMTSTMDMTSQLEEAQQRLCEHPLYQVLDDPGL